MTQFTIVPNPRTAEDFARNWIAKTNDTNSHLSYLEEMFAEFGEIMYQEGYQHGADDNSGHHLSRPDLDYAIDLHDNNR